MFQFLWNFQQQLQFNFQQRNHSILKNFYTTSPNIMEPSPCTPSSSGAFQRHQEHDLKHLGSVNLITSKQTKKPKQNKTNYLPS
jgi:hypothetical protein